MKQKKYNAVISCGGLGTRLNKITKDVPKPLFPISGKSTLERCIVELKKYSINNILVSLGYKKNSFIGFIDKLIPPETIVLNYKVICLVNTSKSLDELNILDKEIKNLMLLLLMK